MTILDNELVRKYFSAFGNGETMAERVLTAMQEPIKKGDKYLQLANGEWREMEWGLPKTITGFHGFDLRLPSRFQAQEKRDELQGVKTTGRIQ